MDWLLSAAISWSQTYWRNLSIDQQNGIYWFNNLSNNYQTFIISIRLKWNVIIIQSNKNPTIRLTYFLNNPFTVLLRSLSLSISLRFFCLSLSSLLELSLFLSKLYVRSRKYETLTASCGPHKMWPSTEKMNSNKSKLLHCDCDEMQKQWVEYVIIMIKRHITHSMTSYSPNSNKSFACCCCGVGGLPCNNGMD